MKNKTHNNSLAKKNARLGLENEDEQRALLADTLKLIDSIFQMRFIQKISRPIQRRVKEEYVEKFAGRMESLHNKLDKIKYEIGERASSDNGNNKVKSVVGSVTNKPTDWKKSIRTIQNRYIEVFLEGSFKFYNKLLTLNSFSYQLKTINITQWAAECLNQRVKQTSCCC